MAGDGLIAAYLRELRFSVARLPDADEIVAEAEDHLLEAVEHLQGRDRRSPAEAEAEALARFGSAELVARICVAESKRGAAVPTRRTRLAGLALFAAPIALVLGHIGNVSTDKDNALHGPAVFVEAMALPLLLFGLWGLRNRHGGLGRAGTAAFVLALVSVPVGFGGYPGFFAALGLLSCALVLFSVTLLRARVLPVFPIIMLGLGPLVGSVLMVTAWAIQDDADAANGLLVTIGFVAVAAAWLGWAMWREPAVDRRRPGSIAAA